MTNYDPRYLEFIKLFNNREYWNSHEVLEHAWLEQKDSPNRLFYKALIQLAAVLFHVEKKQFRPASRLFLSASKYLQGYLPTCLGLEIEPLLKEIELFVTNSKAEDSSLTQKWPLITLDTN